MAVSFLRWKFVDPFDTTLAAEYTFALNPNAMTSPFPRRNITTKATTAINGRTLLIEGQRQPAEWTFSGDFLEPNHYEALRSWVLDRVGRRLFLYDHFGRKLTVVPISFNPTPKRVIARYWRHTYEITCLVLEIEGPTFRVDPPYVVRDLRVVSGFQTAKVTWQPPLSARGSAIKYYKIVNDEQTEHTVLAGQPLQDNMKMFSGGNHTFTVTAVSTAGESEPATVTVYINPIVGPSGFDITTVSLSYTTGKIRWTKPTNDGGSPLAGYDLQIEETSGNVTKGEGRWTLPASATQFDASGLAPFANNYRFTLRAFNEYGEYSASKVRVAQTLRTRGPSAPVITKITATAFSIRVEWAEPTRAALPLTGYRVYLESFVGGNNGDTIRDVPLSQKAVTLTGLRPGVLYRVNVHATDEGPMLSASSAQSVKTIYTQKG